MSKKKDKIKIKFIGGNSSDVTGSATLIEMSDYKILLEFGLYQSNNIKEDHKINNRRLEFKPCDIDYIFIGHPHIDHLGNIGRLYANGCKAKIIAPKGTSSLFSIMGLDCAKIMDRDCETLNRKYGMQANPIYTADDVATCLKYFEEYDYHEKTVLNESITFNFIPSGHIICSSQIELWLTEGNKTSKILYTSDIGNTTVGKYYVKPFEPVEKCNIAIVESTYAGDTKSITNKDKIKDLEKIKSVIDTTCLSNHRKVLIPIFSLDRCQNILTYLYDLYGNDSNFNIPILIDSPLSIKITNKYLELLQDDEDAYNKFNEVLGWKNIKFIENYEESKHWMECKEPCISLAASGMLQAGRSRQWVKALLPDANSYIIFVGFSAVSTIGWKIKHNKNQKSITIDGKPYPNRCGIVNLLSFSSHIQRDEMLKYYSNINCEKICLVHGEMKGKIEFAKELQEEISRKNKSQRVVIINKGTEINL
jgi:metallo-beta-lactamase family protein